MSYIGCDGFPGENMTRPQAGEGRSDDRVLEQAIASAKAGHLSDAERLFKGFLLRHPGHARALSQFGILLAQIGRLEEAEAHIRQAINLGQVSGGIFYNHGTILKHLRRPLDALEAYNRALAIDRANPETWNNRGTVFNDLARYREAISDFDQAIALKPSYAEAISNKAKSLLLGGRPDEALAAYANVLAMRPDLSESWLGQANACLQLGRHAEALTAFDRALALRPDQAEAWLGRANTCYQLKRFDDALIGYDRALALRPPLAEASVGRGSVLGDLKRYGEALAAFDQALATKPDLLKAWLGRAITCYQLRRYEEARSAYERALALMPDSALAWLGCANARSQLKLYDQAVAAYDRSLALDPDLAEAWQGRGEALIELNRTQEAIVALREALARGGDAEAIRFTLAALGAEPAPGVAPKQMFIQFFDQYADTFDGHLVGKLNYRAPELLFDAMTPFAPPRKLDILDLGCGTGLVGAHFRPLAKTLTGLDFSPQMIETARQRQIYDHLVCGELIEFLQSEPGRFDLAVSADVFIYIGDLSPVFEGVRRGLCDGGFFCFSVEISREQDFALQPTRRYGHSASYLRGLADAHGFVVEAMDTKVVRNESDADLPNYIVVLKCA